MARTPRGAPKDKEDVYGTGGPAFPCEFSAGMAPCAPGFMGEPVEPGEHINYSGLSKLDYFAAKFVPLALAYLRDKSNEKWPSWDAVAECAFDIADAMIDARGVMGGSVMDNASEKEMNTPADASQRPNQLRLSLRDYMAAKAMQGMTSSDAYCRDGKPDSDVAERAYRMADAMLAARGQ